MALKVAVGVYALRRLVATVRLPIALVNVHAIDGRLGIVGTAAARR